MKLKLLLVAIVGIVPATMLASSRPSDDIHWTIHEVDAGPSETAAVADINLLGGLMIPALIVGGAAARTGTLDLTWLLALTCLAVGMPLLRRRISRWGGLLIVAAYLAFVASGLALGR